MVTGGNGGVAQSTRLGDPGAVCRILDVTRT